MASPLRRIAEQQRAAEQCVHTLQELRDVFASLQSMPQTREVTTLMFLVLRSSRSVACFLDHAAQQIAAERQRIRQDFACSVFPAIKD